VWKGVTELLYEPVRKAKLIIWITILRQKVQLNFNFFLPRDDIDICTRCTSHGVRLSVCLCLCLSQVGVLLKRINTGSHQQNHTIAQGV